MKKNKLSKEEIHTFNIANSDLDKRRKLSDQDKVEIKQYFEMGHNIRSIAKHKKVSYNTVYYIIYPEKLKEQREKVKAKGGAHKLYVTPEIDKARKAKYLERKKLILQLIK